jgi:hypothetical protein
LAAKRHIGVIAGQQRAKPELLLSSSMADPTLVTAITYDSWLADTLRDYVSGAELISYYIHVSGEPEDIDGYEQVPTFPVNQADQDFIDSVFLWLDPLIDLDFRRQPSYDGTAIDLYAVPAIVGEEDLIIGLTSPLDGWYDVQWLHEGPATQPASKSELITILHEIGHALGLTHPNEEPWDERYDTSDTVMSYNDNLDVEAWFTSADLAALVSLWGAEDDLISPRQRFAGTRWNDRLIGSSVGDDFYGKAGNDRIYANGATFEDPDVITSGRGKDRIVLDGSGFAQILDFRDRRDRITFPGVAPAELSLQADGGDAWIYRGDTLLAQVVDAAYLLSANAMGVIA